MLAAGADDLLPIEATGTDLIARLEVISTSMERDCALDERVAHSQRLETVNSLTGEIAHDLNNLLAVIVGNTELAMLDLSPHAPVQYNLDQIDKATRRAAELAREIQVYPVWSPRRCDGRI